MDTSYPPTFVENQTTTALILEVKVYSGYLSILLLEEHGNKSTFFIRSKNLDCAQPRVSDLITFSRPEKSNLLDFSISNGHTQKLQNLGKTSAIQSLCSLIVRYLHNIDTLQSIYCKTLTFILCKNQSWRLEYLKIENFIIKTFIEDVVYITKDAKYLNNKLDFLINGLSPECSVDEYMDALVKLESIWKSAGASLPKTRQLLKEF